jgi:hypothetical protein
MDEDGSDEKLVEKVAREIVDQHGPEAIPILRERAEAADMIGDELAAEDLARHRRECRAPPAADLAGWDEFLAGRPS